jgi:hypothetical protein
VIQFILSGALSVYFIVYFVSEPFGLPWLNPLFSFLGLLIFASAFFLLRGAALILPIILLVFSTGMIFLTGSDPVILWDGLREMKMILPLVLLVPLVGWIMNQKPYIQAVFKASQKWMKTSTHYYLGLSLLSYAISSFMLMAGIALLHALISGNRPDNTPSRSTEDYFKSTSIMRGYSLTSLFSLFTPAFAYAVQGTGAPLWKTAGIGFILGLIGVLLGWFLFQWYQRNAGGLEMAEMVQDTPTDVAGTGPLLKELILIIIGMISLTLLFLEFTPLNILYVIPLVILLMNLTYFIAIRNLNRLLKATRQFVVQDLPKKSRELTLIFSAGLLVGSLKATGMGALFFSLFLSGLEAIHLNIYTGLTCMIILMGFLGLPPIPGMILVSGILTDLPVGVMPELITLSLLVGVVITLLIAPVTVPLLLISSLNGFSMWQNGFRWNFGFGALFFICGQVYIYLWSWLL